MQAFISWTRADCDVKNVIVERLQQEGIDCWESDEHCHDRGQCTREIRNSRVFIVLIGDAINNNPTGYVYNEIITAREQERNGQLNIILYKLTDAPLHDKLEMELNHIPDANHVSRLQKQGALGGVDLVVRRTKILMELWEKGTPEKPTDIFIPKLAAIPVGRCGYFVEHSRDEMLKSMEDAFAQSNVLILSELFGFGKRSLIRKYADLHRQEYKEILLLSARGRTLREFWLSELEITNINELVFNGLTGEALIRKKAELLAKLGPEYLLIISEVQLGNTPDELLSDLLSTLRCRIILLTQDDGIGYRDIFPIIRVGRMSDEHLSELFFHHYDGTDEAERQKLRQPLYAFFEAMGGHTQTVELTASVLFREIGAYPEELPRYLKVHHGENVQLRDRIFNQIAAMLDLDTLSEDEQIALQLAALLAIPAIGDREYRTLLAKCGVSDHTCIQSLHQRRWINADRRNRIISIEPLIAEICLQKLPPDNGLLIQCVSHIEQQAIQINYDSVRGHIYGRAIHFFEITDLPEIAELFACLQEDPQCSEVGSSERTTLAIQAFCQRYPEPAEEEEDEAPSRRNFELRTVALGRILLTPLQLASQAVLPYLTNFKANASPEASARATSVFGLEAIFDLQGNERQELLEWLESSKALAKELLEKLPSAKETDEDREDLPDDWEEDEFAEFAEDLDETISITIATLTVKVIEDFSGKQYGTLQKDFTDLLDLLEHYPAIFESDDFAPMLEGCFLLIVNSLIASGAGEAALRLCDRILELPLRSHLRFSILNSYADVLESEGNDPGCLAEIRKEMLELFDGHMAATFADRREAATERANLQLQYIDALLLTDESEAGIHTLLSEQVQLARSNPTAYLNTVDNLLQQLLIDGERQEVIDFYEQALPDALCRELQQQKEDETRAKLEELQLLYELLTNPPTATAEPTVAESYYDTYSKEHKMPRSLLRRLSSIAAQAEAFDFSALTEEELREHTDLLRHRADGRLTNDVIAEGFALVSEAGYRILGYRHHTVQYIGAAAMLDKTIAEILNGEGKTYTVILTAFAQYLCGRCVFIIDSSPHLTDRNYTWMGGVLELLGLKVARLHSLSYSQREQVAEDYAADIIYTDFLTAIVNQHQNELAMPDEYIRGIRYDCAIIDEADALLVDDATHNYTLVRSASPRVLQRKVNLCRNAMQLAQEVANREEYYTYEAGSVTLQPALLPLIEQRFGIAFDDLSNVTQVQEIRQLVRNAIYYRNHCTPGVDYHIHKNRIWIEDKRTGRFAQHEGTVRFLLQLKHKDEVEPEPSALESVLLNSTPVHLFLKKFTYLSGTTATAASYRQPLKDIYGLETVSIPPHQAVIRRDIQSPVYLREEYKNNAIVRAVAERYERRQPVLLITADIHKSAQFARMLTQAGIPHRLLNAENAEMITPILAGAGMPGSVLITTAMAGRGVDIKLGGDPERMSRSALVTEGVDVSGLDEILYHRPLEQQMKQPLYVSYQSMLLLNRVRAASQRKQVLESGGLCVICTEFFDDPRLEQQARGRAGRQGEPGESIVFRSIEDGPFNAVPKIAERLHKLYEVLHVDFEHMDDSKLFDQSALTLRERLYKQRLSMLERSGWTGILLEDKKEKYLGTVELLGQGRLSAQEALHRWILSPEIVEHIRTVQKNPTRTSALRRLPEAEKYLALPSRRAAEAIFEFLWQDLYEKTEGNEGKLKLTVAQALKEAWQRFLPQAMATVENTVNIEKNEQYRKSVQQIVNEQHQLHYSNALEQLITLRLW